MRPITLCGTSQWNGPARRKKILVPQHLFFPSSESHNFNQNHSVSRMLGMDGELEVEGQREKPRTKPHSWKAMLSTTLHVANISYDGF